MLTHQSVVVFSSRRRHTRSYGDWSSDVCSSDLGEPKLVAPFERTKQPEPNRRHATVPPLGPEDVARNGDRFDAAGLRVFLDEVAADQRPLQLGEELDGFGRVGRQHAIEAALCRALTDER